METPINGARLSSSFGMRKHPIDGFNKMHEELICTPMGTPIMASGNGKIKSRMEWRWWKLCSHKNITLLQTVYAHVKKKKRNKK